MIKLFFTICKLVLITHGCAIQSNQNEYYLTSKLLIEHLQNNDTAAIFNLFNNEYTLKTKRYYIGQDLTEFNRITSKHGLPGEVDFYNEIGENNEHVVRIPLLKIADSALNIKSSEVLIFFLPEEFNQPKSRINDYGIFTTPLLKKEKVFKIEKMQ
jgi:hypothetical protein